MNFAGLASNLVVALIDLLLGTWASILEASRLLSSPVDFLLIVIVSTLIRISEITGELFGPTDHIILVPHLLGPVDQLGVLVRLRHLVWTLRPPGNTTASAL